MKAPLKAWRLGHGFQASLMTQHMAITETLQKGATPEMGAPKQTTQAEGVELDQAISNSNHIEHEMLLLEEATTK